MTEELIVDIEERIREIFEGVVSRSYAPLAVFQGMRSIIRDLQQQCDKSRTELESLRAQLKAAKSVITEACVKAVEKLKEVAPGHGWDSGEAVAEMYIRKLASAQIPGQQSPAVAVPDDHMHVSEFIDLCKSFSSRTGSIYIGDVESALSGILSADRPLQSPRITEQDAREIAESVIDFLIQAPGEKIDADKLPDEWVVSDEGRALLDKLNNQ